MDGGTFMSFLQTCYVNVLETLHWFSLNWTLWLLDMRNCSRKIAVHNERLYTPHAVCVCACVCVCARAPSSIRVCLCVCHEAGGEIPLVYYLSPSKIGDVFLPGCWAGLRLKGLNREGTKASEPEGGGERMSRWDDNAAWHLWNESLVTMAKKRDGTVSQEPRIKPAVNDVWLVFRSCSTARQRQFVSYLCTSTSAIVRPTAWNLKL